MFVIDIDDIVDGTLLDNKTYVQHKSLRIPSLFVVIENQRLFVCNCYEWLGDADQQEVIKRIVMYAMILVVDLQVVKVERDIDNRASERMCRLSFQRSWSWFPMTFFLSRCWIRSGSTSPYLARDNHQAYWVKAPQAFQALHLQKCHVWHYQPAWCHDIVQWRVGLCVGSFSAFAFVLLWLGDLCVLANTTVDKSDFLILKWQLDDNRTALMHLSLEVIFQAM